MAAHVHNDENIYNTETPTTTQRMESEQKMQRTDNANLYTP